jgi:hypothetical protein
VLGLFCIAHRAIAHGEVNHPGVLATIRIVSGWSSESIRKWQLNATHPGANTVSDTRIDPDEGLSEADGVTQAVRNLSEFRLGIHGKRPDIISVRGVCRVGVEGQVAQTPRVRPVIRPTMLISPRNRYPLVETCAIHDACTDIESAHVDCLRFIRRAQKRRNDWPSCRVKPSVDPDGVPGGQWWGFRGDGETCVGVGYGCSWSWSHHGDWRPPHCPVR